MDSPHAEERLDIETTTMDDVDRIEEIRRGVSELAERAELDKSSALQIVRLFHAMEMLLCHECGKRDAVIASLRADMERSRLESELDRLASRHHQEEAVQPPSRKRSFR